MAYALEARSPLLDHELMEFAASIPADLKVRGREKKWIFREALRGWIPDDILDRPKQGFSVPISEWLRTDLRPLLHDVHLDDGTLDRGYFRPDTVRSMLARHEHGAESESKPLWAMFMLELWQREFVDASRGRTALSAITGATQPDD
jgi:asparagine synthase (glutamine-hydrolysing)